MATAHRPGSVILCLLVGSCTGLSEGEDWKPVGWGGGGLYWSVAFHPKKDGVIYMGGDVVGIYKSLDHGLSWKHANHGIAGYEVLTLATDAVQPERVYAVTTNGISRSENGGVDWGTLKSSSPAELNLVCEKFKSIHCLAANGKRLAFAAPDGRVLESSDFGSSWTTRLSVKPGFASSVAFQPKNGALFAATSTGLYRIQETVKQVVPYKAYALAFDAKGDIGYSAMADHGIWQTKDGGLHWSPTSLGGKAGDEWIDVVVDSKNPLNVHAIQAPGWGGQSASSEDGGKTWSMAGKIQGDSVWNPTELERIKSGPVDFSAPRNLAINPLNGKELAIAANWRPVHSSDSGKTWEERSRGADISVITDVEFSQGKTYVTAMDEGLFVSDNSPVGWRQLLPLRWSKEESGHQWRVRAWDGGKQILSTCSPWDTPANLVYRSLDGGQTFIKVSDGLPAYLPTANTMWGRGYPRALATDPNNPYTVYLGIDGDADANGNGGGLFKSVDGGWHWAQLKNQPGSRRMFNGLALDPTDANRIYWGACGVGGGLYRSDDGGTSWNLALSKEDWVFNVAVGPDGTVYCPGKELWISRDHGITWRQITHFGDGLQIVGVEVDPANPDRVWLSRNAWDATTRGGVFETTDGGNTWHDILGNLPCERPTVLRYNAVTKELWAAGPGLFTLKR